jgi:hypothetical protein
MILADSLYTPNPVVGIPVKHPQAEISRRTSPPEKHKGKDKNVYTNIYIYASKKYINKCVYIHIQVLLVTGWK